MNYGHYLIQYLSSLSSHLYVASPVILIEDMRYFFWSALKKKEIINCGQY